MKLFLLFICILSIINAQKPFYINLFNVDDEMKNIISNVLIRNYIIRVLMK